jgi:hypothetical protein
MHAAGWLRVERSADPEAAVDQMLDIAREAIEFSEATAREQHWPRHGGTRSTLIMAVIADADRDRRHAAAIREISVTIEKLSEISSTIAAAVEEQDATTRRRPQRLDAYSTYGAYSRMTVVSRLCRFSLG